jgi:hypothetical protein
MLAPVCAIRPFIPAIQKAIEVLLLVAHTYEQDDDEERIRIISARKATPGEAETYHAQFHTGHSLGRGGKEPACQGADGSRIGRFGQREKPDS